MSGHLEAAIAHEVGEFHVGEVIHSSFGGRSDLAASPTNRETADLVIFLPKFFDSERPLGQSLSGTNDLGVFRTNSSGKP